MTRAEEILYLIDEVKPTKPGGAFKGQYRFNPGPKKPVHLRMRQDKMKARKSLQKAVYPKPHRGASNHTRDKVSTPLSDKINKTPIHKIG